MTINDETLVPSGALPPTMIGRSISHDLVPADLRPDPDGDLALFFELTHPDIILANDEEENQSTVGDKLWQLLYYFKQLFFDLMI